MSGKKFLGAIVLALISALTFACAAGLGACVNSSQNGGQNGGQAGDIPSTEIAVTGVSLSRTSLSLDAGESYTLTATVSPSDATNKNITWSTSDSSVATVSGGRVTAVAAGSAIIRAQSDNDKGAICSVKVNEPAPEIIEVTSVSLSLTTLSLEVGESYALTATVLPSNATDKSVTWSSSDNSVATVVNGRVAAVAEGSASITATTNNGKKAACAVTVNEPAPEIIEVTSISLSQTSLTLEVGETYTLAATVLPSNATDKSITWTSSDNSVATVVNGRVAAVAEGSASITATTNNGKKATCTVTVNEPAPEIIEVTSISLSQTSLTLEVGETYTLAATVLPSNATDKSVTWSSSDNSVATVVNGRVVAVAEGSASITATTNNGKKATCTVTVNEPYTEVTSIFLSEESLTMNLGSTHTLTATILPENATDKDVSWESSDENIVSVTDGVLTANQIGGTTIVATTGNGIEALCEVKVEKFAEEFSFPYSYYTLEVGNTSWLTCYYSPFDATYLGDLTYTISDESVLSRNSDGSYTALKEGWVTLTVTSSLGFSASCPVHCYTIEITSISFSSNTWTIVVGESGYLRYSVSPTNATETTLEWTSSDESIVKVSENGFIEAVGEGTATITVTAPNGVIAQSNVECYRYTLEIPELPFNMVNTSNPAYFTTERATITNIEYEFSTGSSWLEFTIEGTKTYDMTGGSNVFKINFKVVNKATNVVVDSGTLSSASIAAGESFVINGSAYVYDTPVESGDYELVLTGVAW